MKIFNAAELYTTKNYSCEVTLCDTSHPNGHRIMLELFNDGTLISQIDKDIELYFTYDVLYLGYIGVKKKYRGGIFKELHTSCIAVLKKYGYKKVRLKPLSSVLTMWIYLGFSFEKKIEEIKTRYLLIDYLKSLNLILDKEIKKYDKIPLIEIISTYKKEFKSNAFPKLVDANLYYSNLHKEIV